MKLYGAQWVVPVEGSPIREGVIAVEAGRILRIGHATRFENGQIEHLGSVAILPGLINAHCHLELGHLRGRIAPSPYWEWVEKVITESRRPGEQERRHLSISSGAAESLAGGVTCIGDISRTGLNAEVLSRYPLRKVCFIELISGAQLPPNDFPSLVEKFESLSGLQSETLRLGISPHAPYTVTLSDMASAAQFAVQRGCPWTMHYLETAEELSWHEAEGGKLSAFLEKHGLPGREGGAANDSLGGDTWVHRCRPLLAHVNYLRDADIEVLRRAQASVVWCPRTHRYFGHPPHRWRELLDAGVNVCVGTDSLASNPDLSILEELRAVRHVAADIAPSRIIELGTIRGARALGEEARIGSLTPGKSADFVSVTIEHDCHDPIVSILDGTAAAEKVWIAGQVVHQADFGHDESQ
jgi:cytosine/adenosine deaminase-related metal-dependent hydrolase